MCYVLLFSVFTKQIVDKIYGILLIYQSEMVGVVLKRKLQANSSLIPFHLTLMLERF